MKLIRLSRSRLRDNIDEDGSWLSDHDIPIQAAVKQFITCALLSLNQFRQSVAEEIEYAHYLAVDDMRARVRGLCLLIGPCPNGYFDIACILISAFHDGEQARKMASAVIELVRSLPQANKLLTPGLSNFCTAHRIIVGAESVRLEAAEGKFPQCWIWRYRLSFADQPVLFSL